jgi:hypothetical protein
MYFYSEFGKIYIHIHEIDKVNTLDRWPTPFCDIFMAQFFNCFLLSHHLPSSSESHLINPSFSLAVLFLLPLSSLVYLIQS